MMNKGSCFSQKKIGGHNHRHHHHPLMLPGRCDRESTENINVAVDDVKKYDHHHLSDVDRRIERPKMNGHDHQKEDIDDDIEDEHEYDGDDDEISQDIIDVLIDVKKGERSDHTRRRSNVQRKKDLESSIPDLVSFTEVSFSDHRRSSIEASNIHLEEEDDDDDQDEFYEDSISSLDATASYSNSIGTAGTTITHQQW